MPPPSYNPLFLVNTLTPPTEMPLSLLPPIAAALAVVFAISFSSSAADDTFQNCNREFNCGSLQNISYPFTGGDRPNYCGLPELHLTCRNNTYAELTTTDSTTYRVLHINQTQQTLLLTRPDLWNDTCPTKFSNLTLNSSVLTYGVGNVDLTLFYGCYSLPTNYTPYNRFNCAVNGANNNNNASDAFYVVGPVPVDPILQNVTNCSLMVTGKVSGDVFTRLTLNQTTLGETLREGFNVNYSDPYSVHCSSCNSIGGQCGFNVNSSEPFCICNDRPCDVPRGTQKNDLSSSSNITVNPGSPKNIALFIAGAILAGIGMGWCIFSCRQRRIRKRKAARSSMAKSIDISSPSLSKRLTTIPSTHFTRSIPSFPSSKSEFGKSSTYFGVQVFSYDELEVATNNFDCARELGDGGFGTVYFGQLQDGRVVAVKRLYENNFKRVEQFMNEVEILTRLHHENLVKLYGCTSRRSRELLLVYEYIPNGTVADHLHGRRVNSGLLSWSVRLNIAIETADALAYLHASDIIHRDVKTNNILLDNNFRVKVADFGLSRLFPNDVTHVSTAPQGTPGYVDPEYYQCYQLTEKSDVYSFGVVLIELISSKQAVDTNRTRQDINLSNMAINKIQNHALHELVDQSLGFETNSSVRRMTTLVAELAFRCLQTEKDMRPSMEEVLVGLRGIKKEELNAQKAEVLDIVVEDHVQLLKGNHPPMSPDSEATEKWVSS